MSRGGDRGCVNDDEWFRNALQLYNKSQYSNPTANHPANPSTKRETNILVSTIETFLQTRLLCVGGGGWCRHLFALFQTNIHLFNTPPHYFSFHPLFAMVISEHFVWRNLTVINNSKFLCIHKEIFATLTSWKIAVG